MVGETDTVADSLTDVVSLRDSPQPARHPLPSDSGSVCLWDRMWATGPETAARATQRPCRPTEDRGLRREPRVRRRGVPGCQAPFWRRPGQRRERPRLYPAALRWGSTFLNGPLYLIKSVS
ncbi:unnamed protein product [Arctogadus glacialis]